MSDNTTDTPETNVDGVEPSMEDILASIRRIIADDDQANAEFAGGLSDESIAEAVKIPEPQELAPQNTSPEAILEPPMETLELAAQQMDVETEDLPMEDVGEADTLTLTPLDVLAENDALDELGSDIEALDDLSALEGMEELSGGDDVAALEDLLTDDESKTPAKGEGTQRLTGLAGLAAAGLGAAAAAGSGVANAIKSERQSPTVGETDDIVSLTDSADMAMEDLDLVLDDVSGNHNDQTEDKAAQLETSSASDVEDSIDDLDRLLNSMLGDSPAAEPEPEPEPEAEFVVDPAADLIAETRDADEGEDIDDLLSDLLGEDGEVEDSGVLELDGQDLGESKPQSDPDLDLVKSLMADLTDDPYPDNSAPETGLALDDLEDPDDLEDYVIDEILELSMEDEEDLQQNSGSDVDIADLVAPLPEPEAADEAVQDNSPFFIDINADLSKPETAKPSLSDIAKSTKAEAERIKNQGFSTGQFAAGAGVAVAASGPLAALVKNNKAAEVQQAADKDDTAAAVTEPAEEKEPEATNSATETKSKKTIATPLKETADMPKASAKDTIVDNATEDATASAFASLNKVIDEKTTMAERGDRIGDLVQEALRPMLKEWLDKNLKGIVERAVTKEVKRISSGK